jgi:hypothetical protein
MEVSGRVLEHVGDGGEARVRMRRERQAGHPEVVEDGDGGRCHAQRVQVDVLKS